MMNNIYLYLETFYNLSLETLLKLSLETLYKHLYK